MNDKSTTDRLERFFYTFKDKDWGAVQKLPYIGKRYKWDSTGYPEDPKWYTKTSDETGLLTSSMMTYGELLQFNSFGYDIPRCDTDTELKCEKAKDIT